MAGTWQPFPRGLNNPTAFINSLPEKTKKMIGTGEGRITHVYWTSLDNAAEPSMISIRVPPKSPGAKSSSITLKLPNKKEELAKFPAASKDKPLKISLYTNITEMIIPNEKDANEARIEGLERKIADQGRRIRRLEETINRRAE